MAIVLRKGLVVGAMSAEDDERFLEECFVETGNVTQIQDVSNPASIALGRTGSGKSAIILHLFHSNENTVKIDPDSLSLNYISNSNILRFFEDLDIDLGVFYQLLWRHILVVELLKLKKQFHDENSARKWLQNVINAFNPNDKKRKSLDYLMKFGDSFWLDTEKRIREVVHKIESSLEDSMGMSASALKARIAADIKDRNAESVAVTTEIIHRAQKVVNSTQIQELNDVMNFLSEDVFNDSKESYYIFIDDLDTGWVHDNLRFKLVRALIETIKKFRRISNLKIVIGLRADLLESVLQNTQSKGFQTEKYEDMMIRVSWTKKELKELVDRRINKLFRDKYTTKDVSFEDIFPGKIGDVDSFSYILDRSLYRPRDVISFVNESLDAADGSTAVSAKSIRNAEGTYSKKRLRSIADEWREVYGDLELPLEALAALPERFKLADVSEQILEDLCIKVIAGDTRASGRFANECEKLTMNSGNISSIRRAFVEIMYVVGAIGVKRSAGTPFEWSFRSEPTLNYNYLSDEAKFAIHPMLHRALNKKGSAASFF